jgi:hypothetical protein
MLSSGQALLFKYNPDMPGQARLDSHAWEFGVGLGDRRGMMDVGSKK